MTFRFTTEDQIIDYLPNLGKNMVLYSIAIEENNTYYLSDLYESVKIEHFKEGTFLNWLVSFLDPYYHMSKWVKNEVIELRLAKFHSFFINEDDDVSAMEIENCNGTKEII